MLKLFELVPIDFNLVKRILTSFSNLHYCDGVLYDLNNSRVHELRGRSYQKHFNQKESILLFTLAGTIAYDRTIMYIIHTDYMDYVNHVHGKMKRFSSLHAYIKDLLGSESKMAAYKIKVLLNIYPTITDYLLHIYPLFT
jgi:hypothetical protein